MDRARLNRIRNFQSDDWYPALFIRPLTIAIMLVVADWRVLTPNRLTTIANLCKVAAAALIVPSWAAAVGLGGDAGTIAAVVLLQLGVVFDHLDGTMARYRRTFTTFGSFYDKASDIITWFAISEAIGWRAYVESGEPLTYLQGHGNIIPGLEAALSGHAAGDHLQVTVQPSDGYGERDEEAIQVIAREDFDDDIEVGATYFAQAEDGSVTPFTVLSLEGDDVTVDFNPPLAGEVLNFEFRIM